MITSGVQKLFIISPLTLISPLDQSADVFKIILGSCHFSLYVQRKLICYKIKIKIFSYKRNVWVCDDLEMFFKYTLWDQTFSLWTKAENTSLEDEMNLEKYLIGLFSLYGITTFVIQQFNDDGDTIMFPIYLYLTAWMYWHKRYWFEYYAISRNIHFWCHQNYLLFYNIRSYHPISEYWKQFSIK